MTTPKLNVVDVGVPEMTLPVSERPAGNAPVTDQTQLTQPGACNDWLYAAPTSPTGSSPFVVIANGSTTRVKPNVRELPVPKSVSVIWGPKLPLELGVPRSCPFASMVTSGGRFVADQVYGPMPPYGSNVKEYGAPSVAFGSGFCDRMWSGEMVIVIMRSTNDPGVVSLTRIVVV